MFEQAEISNYSTNKKLGVRFGPGVTTLIGKSFKGKSAFIRALKWVCLNVPAGVNFINWDAKKTAVRLTADGRQVVRKRSKSINIYKLQGMKKPYKAFGNDVPYDIDVFLNVGEINFQGQHDRPFWFAETAGEVSRQLNAIVNLKVIDTTLANIASKIRTADTTIKVVQDRLEKAVTAKQELVYVKHLDADLQYVESLTTQLAAGQITQAEMKELLDLGTTYQKAKENMRELESDAQVAVEKCENYIGHSKKAKRLKQVIDEVRRLTNLASVEIPNTDNLDTLTKRIEAGWLTATQLRDTINSIKHYQEMECQAETKIIMYQKEEEKLTQGKCPVCKRTWTKSA